VAEFITNLFWDLIDYLREMLLICRVALGRSLALRAPDRDILASEIRLAAHIVDKELQLHRSLENTTWHVQLGKMISIYESKFVTADPSVLWAKEILKRYRMNIAEGGGESPATEPSYQASRRTSIRRFRDGAIPDSMVAQVIDAGVWAPSSCNRQPCRFLVVRSPDLVRRIGSSLVGGTGFADKAPVIIVALVDLRMYSMPGDRHLPYLDAGAATMSMLSTVHSLGLGGCWMNWKLKTRARRISKLLGVGRYEVPISAIALGHPEFIPVPPSRTTPESVTRFL